MDIGLLVLRLAVGLILAAHGAQKLFGWFGGYGIAGTAGFFESLGFRPGKLQALLAGSAEFFGGLLLAAGLATPLAALLIVSVMLVAIVSVHAGKGLFASKGGYEYNLVLAATAAALAFTGPGAWSIDALAGFATGGWRSGVGAVVLGLAGGAGALLARAPKSAPANG